MSRARANAPLVRLGAGLGALAIAAATISGDGLLVPGATIDASTESGLRVVGVLAAVVALGALIRQPGVGLRRAPVVLATAGAVATALALVTLPVSPVRLDWATPSESPAPPDGTAGGAETGPPPLLRLPEGSRLERRDVDLWVILPDESETRLGTTGEAGAGASGAEPMALPPGQVLGIQPGPSGGLQVVGEGGGVVADVPTDGPGLALGDVRIETAEGGGVVDVAGGGVRELGDGTFDDVTLPPDEPADDLLATVTGIAVALATFWMVFLHSPRYVPRPRPPRAPAAPVLVEPVPTGGDGGGAEGGLQATLDVMLGDPDPRTAIVGAYAVLLHALEGGELARSPEEAPHEHLHRALDRQGVHTEAVHDLADLFVRARFSPSPMTVADRDRAIALLRQAVDDLRVKELV